MRNQRRPGSGRRATALASCLLLGAALAGCATTREGASGTEPVAIRPAEARRVTQPVQRALVRAARVFAPVGRDVREVRTRARALALDAARGLMDAAAGRARALADTACELTDGLWVRAGAASSGLEVGYEPWPPTPGVSTAGSTLEAVVPE